MQKRGHGLERCPATQQVRCTRMSKEMGGRKIRAINPGPSHGAPDN